MDGVALASVIISGVLGITTSSIAVWSARQNTKLARETRVQQRLGESYLEVLRIVEHEGQWVETKIKNWNSVAVEFEHEVHLPRVVIPQPAVTDRATLAAHLAAFGSPNVRRFYQAWRSIITAIESLEDSMRWDWVEHSEGVNSGDLNQLETLSRDEHRARQALADAMAYDLGHR